MKIAIIGSRNLTVENLEKYLPLGVDWNCIRRGKGN